MSTVEKCVEIPNYLSEELFSSIIRKYLKEEKNVKIQKINYQMGSSPGENYCSQIYRVTVTFKISNVDTLSIIVKSMPETATNIVLTHLNVYEREKLMYTEILPRVEDLLKGEKIGPRCIHTMSDPVRTIFMEDMQPLGYVKADREAGLDEPHARLLMEKLGKYHAASIIVCEKNPKLVDYFQYGMHRPETKNDKLMESVFYDNIPHIIALTETWPGFEKIAEKLKYIFSNIKRLILDHVQPHPDEFKVLNHGDLWVNNFLFKYNKNEPKVEDVLFVDYQMSFFTSPGIDIQYFLNTSLHFDLLVNKRDLLISTYYKALSDTLMNLKYHKIPTEDSVRKEISRKEFYGFVSLEAIFPFISMEKKTSQDNSFETFQDNDVMVQKRKDMFSSKRVQDTLKYCLRRFDDLKVFDSLI